MIRMSMIAVNRLEVVPLSSRRKTSAVMSETEMRNMALNIISACLAIIMSTTKAVQRPARIDGARMTAESVKTGASETALVD